ncbi:V-type ATP synthase subunit I [Spirochaeta cellobiosiphila]|uniref:V-type ATP synthase subunit I n=1 Tax=Spirochaeta cellobiosiphila TaxID=504483 RepID=UPI000422EFD1|nr:hypothetical protein [Spirochaeta cellobiosiphila]
MIVPMKKASLVIYEHFKQSTLDGLKSLGVVHLETKYGDNEAIRNVTDKIEVTKNVLTTLKNIKSKKQENHPDGGLGVVESVDELLKEQADLKSELDSIDKEITSLNPWGDFDPKDFVYLDQQGIKLRLFASTNKVYKSLPEDMKVFFINQDKSKVYYVVVDNGEDLAIQADEVRWPERGLASLQKARSIIVKRMSEIAILIKDFGVNADQVAQLLVSYEDKLQDALVDHSTEDIDSLCVIDGFVPIDKVDDLKSLAKEIGIGLLLREPTEEDQVPTLIRRKGPIKLVKPLFNLLGTLPGYEEVDISAMFLIAFSLFVAMIVGDAGYGSIFLVASVFGFAKTKPTGKLPFALAIVLSTCIVIWGALTGTWFGSAYIASLPGFKDIIIPQIASFARDGIDSGTNVQILCFVIGIVHLTLARGQNFFRKLPKLNAFADLGWLITLWGLFILVMQVVAKKTTLFGFELTPYAIPLLAVGFPMIIIFAGQDGNFFKGLLKGLNPMNLLTTGLDGVSAFSDIISYIRLYAVGLATVAVAESFNSLAGGVMSMPLGMLFGGLILVFGHGLNIILAIMSVLVHGVRLNMLEYSGHLDLAWAGFEYKPFAKKGLNVE